MGIARRKKILSSVHHNNSPRLLCRVPARWPSAPTMPEETPAASSSSGSMEEKPCSSTSAPDSTDVMEEAKKLIGTGNRHLVMGDFVSAVNVFQEACGMLAARYGDTADECGEAFFLCGKSLLELARMENTVLGNALERVQITSMERKMMMMMKTMMMMMMMQRRVTPKTRVKKRKKLVT